MVKGLLNALASLAADLLTGITNAFAFIWLRRVVAPHIRCKLTNQLAIDAIDANFSIVSHRDLQGRWDRMKNRMAFADAQIKLVAFDGSPEASALDLKAFGESIADALDQIVDDGARCAVHSTSTTIFRGPGDGENGLANFQINPVRQGPFEFALRSLDGH
jgi:hypothetical protein